MLIPHCNCLSKRGATPSLLHRPRTQARYVAQWLMYLLMWLLRTQSRVHLRPDSLNSSLGYCHSWEPVAGIQKLSSCFISHRRMSFFPLLQFSDAAWDTWRRNSCPPSSPRALAKLHTPQQKSERVQQHWQEINDIHNAKWLSFTPFSPSTEGQK